MSIGKIILGVCVLAVSFTGAIFIMNVLWPATLGQGPPPLAVPSPPPLQPLTGSSTVFAPVAIAMSAIRDALEARAPHDLAGKRPNPLPQLLSNADINWTVTRGPLNVSGQSNALVITTPLSGTLQALGQIAAVPNSVGEALGNLLGGNLSQQVQNLAGKAFDRHAEIRGTVTTTSRPTIAPNWRLAPNLAAQINVSDVALPVAGIKLSVANEVKPFLDNAVREQTNALEARLRTDPFIENAARSEWTKICRTISLGATGQGMPDLWLEIRPTRALAAQPTIDADAVTLLVGVQAEARIVPNETKPTCPFPQQLEIVQQASEGRLSVVVPIDIPFTEVSRLLEARIKGKTFPEDGSGSLAITIRHAAVTAFGDRLLISLLVHVKKRGFFSIGADADVRVWGRPALDQDHQILRLSDIALDVESRTAFGLLGTAAQAAVPYLRRTLAEQAIIDLKPFADDAKNRLTAAVGNFTKQGSGVSGSVTVNALRLVGIAYDDKTLRFIANADGAVSVAISSLAMQ